MDLKVSDLQLDLPSGKSLFRIPNLEIPSGTHVLITGDSGCGKTTFLHLLAGLVLPRRGYVSFGSTRLDSLSERERGRFRRDHVGVIFQKLNLLDQLDVRENVGLLGVGDVAAAIEAVGLAGRERDRVSHMSLGEQQRVAVARVLAQAPQLLLADEPTSSLDARNTENVMRLLKEAARGKTLVVVSHDERVARHFDRVIAFKDYVA